MNFIKKWLVKAIGGVAASLSLRFFGGSIVPYADRKNTYVDEGYRGNDIIYACVSLIRETAKIAPWGWYKVVDEEAYKSYNAELRKDQPDFYKAAQYRKKALELYTANQRLNLMIKYPNENQTWQELNGELWTWKLVTGDYFEYWDKPSGGLNAGIPVSMSALPSQHMVIESENGLPLTSKRYFLQLGQHIAFEKDQILHEKYVNLQWDVYGIQLYGMSPLEPARRRLQRNNESQKAGAVAQANGGMRGVAYFDDERLVATETDSQQQMSATKKSFQNEMRPGTDGTGHVFWSPYKVGYSQLGFSPKDLDTSTFELNDLRMFCAIYGIPSQLLNDPAAKTYNTTIEAEKALITRCVLPLLCARRDSVNRKMGRTDNIVLDFDLSVYDQLQPNKVQIADWVNKMPLTNARKLEIIGEDVPEGWDEETRNAVLVPTGFQNLEDVVAPLPEPQDQQMQQITNRNLNQE